MLQPPRRRGRPPKYPWATWLDGERRLLRPGQDFPLGMSIENFRVQVYAAARRRNVRIKAVKYGDGLMVQAQPQVEARGPGRPPAYNWDVLLDGNVHVCRRRFDFTGKPQNFAATVRGTARRRGLRASVVVLDNDSVQIVARPANVMPQPKPQRILIPDEPLECWDEQMDREDWKAMVELDAEDLTELLKDSSTLESLLSTPSPSERPGEAVSGERPQTQEVDSGTAWTAASAE